jgi:hypothetical protein
MSYQQPITPQYAGPATPHGKSLRRRLLRVVITVGIALAAILGIAWWTGTLPFLWYKAGERVDSKALGISYVLPYGYKQTLGPKDSEGSLYVATPETFSKSGEGRTLIVTKLGTHPGDTDAVEAGSSEDAVRAAASIRVGRVGSCRVEGERWRTWNGPHLPGAYYSAFCYPKEGGNTSEGATFEKFAYAVVGHPGSRWEVFTSSENEQPVDEYALYNLATSIEPLRN